MRLGIWLMITVSVCFGKNFNHKKSGRSLPVTSQSSSFEMEETSYNTILQRNDTTTIWFDDLEGDVSGWTLEEGWQLTTESANSPSHSFHIPNSYYNLTTSLTSPTISLPQLGSDTAVSYTHLPSPRD